MTFSELPVFAMNSLVDITHPIEFTGSDLHEKQFFNKHTE